MTPGKHQMLSERNDQPSMPRTEAPHSQPTKPGRLPPRSRLGKAAFFSALASGSMIVFFGLVLPIGVLMIGDHTDLSLEFSGILFGIVAPLGFLAAPIVSLTGFCLGIATLVRKGDRKGFAIAGVILNSLILLVFVLLLLWWKFAIEQMIAI